MLLNIPHLMMHEIIVHQIQLDPEVTILLNVPIVCPRSAGVLNHLQSNSCGGQAQSQEYKIFQQSMLL